MKKHPSIILFFIFTFTLASRVFPSFENPNQYRAWQNNKELKDSLAAILPALKGIEKAGATIEFGRLFLYDSTNLALEYLEDGLEMAKQESADTLIRLAALRLSEALIVQGDYNEALEKLDIARQVFKMPLNDAITGEIYYNQANCHYFLGNFSESVSLFQEAEKILRKTPDKNTLANVYQNMGMLYYDLQDNAKSLEYYQKALDINKTLEKKTNIAGLTQNIGLVFLKEEDYVKARDYIEQSLAIYMDINEIKGIATSYSNLGYLHQLNGKYNLARINYEKALEQFIAIDSYIGKIWGYHNIGSALADEEKFREGLENLKISLNLSEEKGHAEGIVYNLKAISDIHEKTGNYKESLNYYKKYIQLNDSIVSAGTRQKIAELEANHKLALNEEELALKNIKLEQQETQKKTFIISSVLLLLITISLYYAYYQKNKTERTLQDQQHMLHELVERRTSELEAQIAERKIAEESDKLKTAFLANMSHELRTPMNAIIAFSSFLNNNELDEKTRETYIQHIHEAGGNLLQLIEDIIDSAKIESKQLSIKKEWCNISLILKELYSIFEKVIQNKEKVHVKLIPDKIIYERDCYIQTDKLRLKQIIANLLDNAIKFTNAGFIQFGFNVRRSTIEFYVKDSGIGIDKQYHDLIFDRFQQVNEKDNELPGGAGLGLAISKNLVHMLDGEMWVESEPGKGSVFYFTFKVDQVEIKEKISQENKKDTGNINKNGHEWENKLVLVAEDEDLNYKVLETILKKAKAKVIRAKNGFEAVELVREKKVDLVLMDIQMPKMDGYEATMEIRKMNRNLPIIAQTSYAMEGTREKCIAAGCNDYLSKPLKIDKLVETIDKLLKTEVFHKSL